MAHNAVLGQVDFTDSQVIDGTHPAVILGMKMTETGEWPQGTLVTVTDGEAAPAASAASATGVLVAPVEIADGKEEVAPILVHGTVDRARLLIGGEAIPEADEPAAFAALGAKGVWAV